MDDRFNQIVTAARAGEGWAFEVLFRGLSHRVLAFSHARRAADPEAIVNESFLQVFRNLRTFEGSEPEFNAWVFTIARNKVIDEKRQLRHRPIEVSEPSLPPDLAPVSDISDDIIGCLSEPEIQRYLNMLTPDQREVVVLRIVGELTISEVAAILDKPISAIKSLQRRAFRTIARRLSHEGVSS